MGLRIASASIGGRRRRWRALMQELLVALAEAVAVVGDKGRRNRWVAEARMVTERGRTVLGDVVTCGLKAIVHTLLEGAGRRWWRGNVGGLRVGASGEKRRAQERQCCEFPDQWFLRGLGPNSGLHKQTRMARKVAEEFGGLIPQRWRSRRKEAVNRCSSGVRSCASARGLERAGVHRRSTHSYVTSVRTGHPFVGASPTLTRCWLGRGSETGGSCSRLGSRTRDLRVGECRPSIRWGRCRFRCRFLLLEPRAG
jgi:hypothetical protein